MRTAPVRLLAAGAVHHDEAASTAAQIASFGMQMEEAGMKRACRPKLHPSVVKYSGHPPQTSDCQTV